VYSESHILAQSEAGFVQKAQINTAALNKYKQQTYGGFETIVG